MQVARDSVAVLEEHHALLVLARVGELEGDRGVIGEGGRHVQVSVVESRPAT